MNVFFASNASSTTSYLLNLVSTFTWVIGGMETDLMHVWMLQVHYFGVIPASCGPLGLLERRTPWLGGTYLKKGGRRGELQVFLGPK